MATIETSTTATSVTPIVEQLPQRPGTLTTIPATETTPEIEFLNSDLECTYVFSRADGFKINFATPHAFGSKLTLALLDPAWENWDVTQEIDLTYAEARILRAYLNRPEVARVLDAAE